MARRLPGASAASLARTPTSLSVIPGLEPGIHAMATGGCGVDARLKAEHDGGRSVRKEPFTALTSGMPFASRTKQCPPWLNRLGEGGRRLRAISAKCMSDVP
ncbi:hypothetical protein EFQ99_00675 [Rhizobium vallis]|uniref:Uncharacterized protein n=1 Tax=Rhizobium vallis TaxID=634290 RepID=A0A3S0Y8E0_9HYPH|nr:hypothetical protein EFQ99_00675 [Rhizobium vallis]